LEDIPDETFKKIVSKVMGQAYMRYLEYRKPIVTIPEFKFIIGTLRVKKSNWHKIAVHLEEEGYVRLHGGNPIVVILASREIPKSDVQRPA
jgi:hypothetical protein